MVGRNVAGWTTDDFRTYVPVTFPENVGENGAADRHSFSGQGTSARKNDTARDRERLCCTYRSVRYGTMTF